jgi:diacylglycerol O-acyltransferase 2, plant
MGAVDAGRETASRVLDDDCSVAVYPGGSREIFSTDPNSSETKVYLSKRRGFVKLAIAHGAALVPVFVFGEKRCYRRLNVPAPLRDWLLRTWKIPLIVFWGRWFTWYPYAARQTVVFGAPIDTKKHKVGPHRTGSHTTAFAS